MSEQMPPLSEAMRQVLYALLDGSHVYRTYIRLFDASQRDDEQFDRDVEALKQWLQKEARP